LQDLENSARSQAKKKIIYVLCACVSLDFSQKERIYEKNIELQESYALNFAKIYQRRLEIRNNCPGAIYSKGN